MTDARAYDESPTAALMEAHRLREAFVEGFLAGNGPSGYFAQILGEDGAARFELAVRALKLSIAPLKHGNLSSRRNAIVTFCAIIGSKSCTVDAS